jgi:cytochrome c
MTKAHVAAAIVATLFAAVLSSPAFAEGDVAAGKTLFNQCRACHQVGPDAQNTVGPVLNGVVGRNAGTFPGYNYSDANKNSGLTWDEATLTEYIKDPRGKVPGTKMVFPGIKQDSRVENIISYLKTIKEDGTGADE